MLNSGVGVLLKVPLGQLVQVLRLRPFLKSSQVVWNNKIHNRAGKHIVQWLNNLIQCIRHPVSHSYTAALSHRQSFSCAASRPLQNHTRNLRCIDQGEFPTLSLKEILSNNNHMIVLPIAFYSRGKKLISTFHVDFKKSYKTLNI